MREASEDPDLLLYLKENVNSLTSADVASLLDYQVYFGRHQNIFTHLKETPETEKIWLGLQVENLVAAVELKEVSIRETPIILSNCALLLRKEQTCYRGIEWRYV